MATSSLRLRQVTSDQIKLSVHAPLALASAAGRRCPLCEHGALACRFVAVDGGAVFALEIKYVSARTAVCAAPEALTPSWSAALLEAAYYVEFSNDNTAFSRVPSGGDAASGDAASDGDAATPFVFTVSPPPSASSSRRRPPRSRAARPSRCAARTSRRAPRSRARSRQRTPPRTTASRSRERSSPRRSSRRSTCRRRQCRHLGWISVVTGALRTCGESLFSIYIFLST